MLDDVLGPGTLVLVAGPPMTGTYELMLHLLAGGDGPAIVISTGTPADEVRADFRDLTEQPPSEVAVVDCASRDRRTDVSDTDTTKYVASPENLTQIGVKFTTLADRYADEDAPVAVGVYSVSELLMYWDANRVYQFLRVLASQIKGHGWSGVAVVGSTMHDEQTLHTLYEPFDTVVETREGENGAREYRLQHKRGKGTGWTEF